MALGANVVPVEGGLGAGVVAEGVEEVGAVLVHAVVDVDCFVLGTLVVFEVWVGRVRGKRRRYPHGSIELFVLGS